MTHRQGDPFPLSVSLILFNRKGRKGIIVNPLSLEEIKNRLIEKQPSLTIVKEIPQVNEHRRFILHCNKCGQEFERNITKIHRKCPICINKKIVKGINDVATTHEWIIPYLKNKEDGFKYSANCHKKVMFCCPKCGYERESLIPTVIRTNYYSCPKCRDKMSRPNKFIRALLPLLPIENLKFEYSSDWTLNKIYDAYFIYKGKEFVVEMDGEQHREDSLWSSKKSQIENDELKNNLAKENNIHIIRIPCEYLQYEDIINNFMNSEIGHLIKESNIDWKTIIDKTETNQFHKVCEYFNNQDCISTVELSKIFNLNKSTIYEYLLLGTKLGLCNYNVEKQRRLGIKYKEIVVKDFDRDEILQFKSVEDCAKYFNVPSRKIARLCRLETKYGNKIFTYKNDELKNRYINNKQLYETCEYLNEHKYMTLKDISIKLNIAVDKLREYIKIGRDLGICNYSIQTGYGNSVIVYDSNNNLIGEFNSYSSCANYIAEFMPQHKIYTHKFTQEFRKHNEFIYKELRFIERKKANE